MKFNIIDDFFINKKLLVFGGKTGTGKTQLLLNFANHLNYDSIYIDVDSCINNITNKNSTILRLINLDDIFSFLINLDNLKNSYNKTLIIIDQISNIRSVGNINDNRYNLKKYYI